MSVFPSVQSNHLLTLSVFGSMKESASYGCSLEWAFERTTAKCGNVQCFPLRAVLFRTSPGLILIQKLLRLYEILRILGQAKRFIRSRSLQISRPLAHTPSMMSTPSESCRHRHHQSNRSAKYNEEKTQSSMQYRQQGENRQHSQISSQKIQNIAMVHNGIICYNIQLNKAGYSIIPSQLNGNVVIKLAQRHKGPFKSVCIDRYRVTIDLCIQR